MVHIALPPDNVLKNNVVVTLLKHTEMNLIVS